jgi:predicted nucleotidyltransferase
MGKTALELTAEELRAYRPARRPLPPQAEDRRKQAWEIARTAAGVLREHFAATRVVAFGSLVHPESFGPWSDIDLAAWGIPAGQFYRAVATVMRISHVFKIDLVDPLDCSPSLRASIESGGIEF